MASVALGQKVVGSVVKMKFDGAMREFLVVHQGKPSSLYDESCNGTWLLMKDCLEARKWHSSNVNDYANSTVNNYLNSTVLSKFDADIQAQIKQVKIPYRPGSGTSGTVNSGANGLSTKIFLLSDREVGYTKSNVNSYICDDGAKLAYFQDGNGTSEKIAKFNGSAVDWWLRSPNLNNSTNAWNVNSNGNANNNNCSYTGYYLRPALMDTPDQVGISRTPRPIFKGDCIPSNFCAWKTDKHKALTLAAVGAVSYQQRRKE